jgi:hypothetical protein
LLEEVQEKTRGNVKGNEKVYITKCKIHITWCEHPNALTPAKNNRRVIKKLKVIV